jgi:hypothetical protein
MYETARAGEYSERDLAVIRTYIFEQLRSIDHLGEWVREVGFVCTGAAGVLRWVTLKTTFAQILHPDAF